MFIATALYCLSRQRVANARINSQCIDSGWRYEDHANDPLPLIYFNGKGGFCQFICPLMYRFKEARQLNKFLAVSSLAHRQFWCINNPTFIIITIIVTITFGKLGYTGPCNLEDLQTCCELPGFRSLTYSDFRDYGRHFRVFTNPVSSSWTQFYYMSQTPLKLVLP